MQKIRYIKTHLDERLDPIWFEPIRDQLVAYLADNDIAPGAILLDDNLIEAIITRLAAAHPEWKQMPMIQECGDTQAIKHLRLTLKNNMQTDRRHMLGQRIVEYKGLSGQTASPLKAQAAAAEDDKSQIATRSKKVLGKRAAQKSKEPSIGQTVTDQEMLMLNDEPDGD